MDTVMCKSEARRGFNYTTRAYRQASAHPGFWDYVGDVVRGVQCYFRIRNARRAPERLPDHALKDMGIRRAEIDAVTARGRKRNQNRTASSSLPLAR
jgi:uncharacterized protein YjiS (DUF1127 family)